MTVTAIPRPLPGERVLELSPDDPAAAAQTWLRRPNLFPGRALTAPTLAARSAWTAGHVTQRGQAFMPGVIDGLEVGTPPALSKGSGASVLLSISAGSGLAASGEDVALRQDLRIALGALQVVAPAGVLSGDDGFGSGALQDRAVGAPVGGTLADFIARRPGVLPRAGVLLLQPVVTDRLDDDDGQDPCDHGGCGAGAVSYEDWRIADGARLLWYAWPVDAPGFALPAAGDLFRNRLAWTVFDAERRLPADAALPWEAFGVPLALIGVDAAFRPQFVDAAAVRRRGGRGRTSRLQLGPGGPGDALLRLAASERLPALFQAQIEQFAEQIAEAGAVAGAPSKLSRQFARLPPCGLLPRNVIDLARLSTAFLPPGMIVDVVPIATEQLDLAIREAAPLAAFDKQPGERIRLLVPVSQASWEPRLLLTETIDPAFAETLQRFLRERARALAGRYVMRLKATVLMTGLRGGLPRLPPLDGDPQAAEAESLAELGLPAASGGHRTLLREGPHGHVIVMAAKPMAIVDLDALYIWVHLDPASPPRSLGIEWRTASGASVLATWGEDLIADDPENPYTARLHFSLLPAADGWQRLSVPASAFGLLNTSLSGLAVRLHDGRIAVASAGVLRKGKELIWLPGLVDAGTSNHAGNAFEHLGYLELANPFEPAHGLLPDASLSLGFRSTVLAALAQSPRFGVLSEQERNVALRDGLERYVVTLRARVDRVDDLVDLGFAKVQADIYRVRQLVLDTTNATRMAVSPSLAGIAQAPTAVATPDRVARFFGELSSRPSVVTAAPVPGATVVAQPARSAPYSFVYTAPAKASARTVQQQTRITAVTSRNLSAVAAVRDIRAGAPLVGSFNVRNVTVAERLKRPAAEEAMEYAVATRLDLIGKLSELCEDFARQDGTQLSGLFTGVTLWRLKIEIENDPAATPPVSYTLAELLNREFNGPLLKKLAQPPHRDAADEGSHFSDASDLSDRTIALLRQLEGRVQQYRDLIEACEDAVAEIRDDLSAIGLRERVHHDALAEARHDVAVTRALIIEEQARLDAINARRAAVLKEEFRYAAFVRPRSADHLDASVSRPLDPGLLPAPVPACLAEHDDAPDELREMLVLLREAPAAWFDQGPKLVAGLDRIDLLVRTVQHARDRAGVARQRPSLVPNAPAAGLDGAIARVQASQRQVVEAARATVLIDPGRLAMAGWQGARQQAAEVISLGDLIDGDHGRNAVARAAADFFDRCSRVCGCLHGAFSSVPPSLRLDWAETLSQFDEAPALRNLASLPGYSGLAFADRRRLQGLVDWLFDQIDGREPRAAGLVNDLVRMCLLLASHAPIGRIITGRLPRPVIARPGLRIPLVALDPARLRIGMQALISRDGTIVARAVVEDLGSGEVSARVLHTVAAEEALDDHAQVQFAEAAAFGVLPKTPAGRGR